VGKAGNIDITTGNLTLTNGARLVSSSSGVGDAGNVNITAKSFSSDRVIPARGMTINEKGQIVLTAYPTPGAGDRTSTQSNYCSERTSIQRTNNSYAFSDRYLVGFFN
jgi:large exoprotein involved in heme utilization and adhesion